MARAHFHFHSRIPGSLSPLFLKSRQLFEGKAAPQSVAATLREELEGVKEYLPLVQALRTP
eukprot:1184281-Rhodomonas_salina.1